MEIADKCICCQCKDLNKSPAVLMPFIADRVFGWKPVIINKSWGLQTIPTGMVYSLCNTLECKKCSLLFLDIRFSQQEQLRLYSNYRSDEYTSLREKYEPEYKQKNLSLLEGSYWIDSIESFLTPYTKPSPRILDWGGDTGKNTPFKNKSRYFHIYDIGSRLSDNHISREQVNEFEYDLIVCSNVLEHVPFPIDVLSDIASVMSNDTILYLEVPYEKIIGECIYPRANYKKHWHEHINFFTTEALNELITLCGLKIIDFKIYQNIAFQIIATRV